jgi:lipoic acid synthetase
MKLRYVVITSVDRDDLRDGGAGHFADCIREARAREPGHHDRDPDVPDFRGKGSTRALEALAPIRPTCSTTTSKRCARLYKRTCAPAPTTTGR